GVPSPAHVRRGLGEKTIIERTDQWSNDARCAHEREPSTRIANRTRAGMGAHMRAIVISDPGGHDVLQLRDVARPTPSRGEVRVRGRATAVNRADLIQRMGGYPAPPGSPADIPGLELAGEVDEVGEDVTELAKGDRVFGLAGGGAYAEEIVVHARTLARIP